MIGKKINQLATELAPVSTDLTIIGDPTTGVSKKITLAQLGAIFSGAVSFYTNLAGFPAVGDINVIYCAKDTQKLYLWSGSAYVEVFPSQALLDTYQLRSEKGNANGYASLDSQGKVPISQLPSSIMEYKGTWNASTNTPTLANGTGDTGDVYICNVAGTVNFGAGPLTFAVGDYVIYSGTIWQRSSGAVGTVTSVAVSRSGDALAITGSPVTTSGTINLGFAGNSTQYINGAGNLVTFPGVINEAQNLITEVYNKTGATLTKGTVVYINGGQGNLPTITKALATSDSTSAQTYGIVRNDITNNNNGYVVVAGRISDLDTQAYTEGTQLYLSPTTAGTFTSTKPYAPQHLVYVGIVVRAHPTQGVVEVKIQNGYEMDELHNVAAQSPSNGDILQYVSATSLWTKVAGTTSNIAEGSNLYYTDARSRAALSFTAGSGAYNSTTGVITIPTNTNQLTNGANFITLASLSAGAGISYNNTTGVIASTITQYTDALARAAISLTTSGTSGAATYNSTTGVLNVPQYAPDLSGYVPTSRTLTINGTAYDLSANRSWSVGTVTSVGLSSATSGVTIGSTPITTSGTITLAIATASGSQQGLLSSTDWTTFNNKQSALTNPVTGTGTTNFLPKFTGASTIGDSLLQDNGTILTYGNNIVQIGASNTSEKYLQINSSTGNLFLGGTSAEHYVYGAGSKPINFYTNSTSKMLLDASGNLGLGVTPSAWGTGTFGFDIGSGSAIYNPGSGNQTQILNNSFNNGTNFIYKNSSAAARYRMIGAAHEWYIADSGTAGNAISFTQAMTLDASGRLGIGVTNMSSYNAGGNQFVIGGGEFRGLTIAATTEGNIYFADGTTGADAYRGTIGYNHTSNYLYFFSDGSERMRLNSIGNLLLGTTSDPGYGRKTASIYDTNGGILQVAGSSTTALFYVYQPTNEAVIGTTTNHNLAIHTNGLQRVLIANSGAATFSSSVTAGTGQGFMNLSYQSGYNRIWSFGSGSEPYGMGYYQGSGAPGGSDCIGLHFGNTASPLFYFNNFGQATFSSSLTATQYTATSTGGSGLRVYGASGTNQWDMYLNSTNLRFSDNTGTGKVVFDTTIQTPLAYVTSSAAIVLLNRTGGTTFGAGVQYQTSGTNNWIVGTAQATIGTDYSIYNYNTGTGAINITYATNNIQIGGTADAGYKLDVSGTGRFAASYTASGSVAIETWQRAGGAVSADMTYNDANTSMNFGTSTSHTLNIKTNNTTALSIASGGAATFSSSVKSTQFQLTNSSGQYYYFDNATGNNFIGLTATNTLGLYVGGNLSLSIASTGAATFSDSIKTGEPDTGWGRAAIKIGASVSGTAFNVTRYLPVSVDGTVYYINLNSSTP